MSFNVKEILTVDTIKVTPEWRLWALKKGGEKIRFWDFNVPHNKSIRTDVKIKLFNLLNSKSVEIKGVYKVTPDKVAVCDVYFDGKPIKEYFPELTVIPELTSSQDMLQDTISPEDTSSNDQQAE